MPQQPEAGSVDRSVDEELFDEIVKPQQYGAITLGADHTSAVQEALAAIQARGGGYTLRLSPKFPWNIGNLTYTGDNLHVDARGAIINKIGTTGDLLNVTGGKFLWVGGILQSSLVNTSGFAIRVSGDHAWIEKTLMHQLYSGIYIGGTQSYVNRTTLASLKHHGLHYGPTVGGFVDIASTYINGPENDTNDGCGVLFENGDTFTLVNMNVASHREGVVLRPPSEKFIRNFYATNVLVDGVGRTNSEAGWVLDGSDGTDVRRLTLNGCWGCTTADHGLRAIDVQDVDIVDFRAVGNEKHGISIEDDCKDIRVRGGMLSGNSRDAPGVYSGAFIKNGVNWVSMKGVRSGESDGWFNSQKHGIEVEGNTHDWLEIEDNNTAANVAAEITWGRWSGENNILRPRLGLMPTYPSAAAAAAANYPKGGIYKFDQGGNVFFCVNQT